VQWFDPRHGGPLQQGSAPKVQGYDSPFVPAQRLDGDSTPLTLLYCESNLDAQTPAGGQAFSSPAQ
jgi:hypothetical protein